jgi:uncharacterized protein (UPF0335 family)
MSDLSEVATGLHRRVYLERIRQLEKEKDELRGDLRSREMELAHVYRELEEAHRKAEQLTAALQRRAA